MITTIRLPPPTPRLAKQNKDSPLLHNLVSVKPTRVHSISILVRNGRTPLNVYPDAEKKHTTTLKVAAKHRKYASRAKTIYGVNIDLLFFSSC